MTRQVPSGPAAQAEPAAQAGPAAQAERGYRHQPRPGWLRPGSLIVIYPPPWRRRYGDELEALIDDLREHGRRTAPIVADLLRGALTAWFTYRRVAMPEQRRSALLAVLWSWVPFAAIAAWYGRDLNVSPTRPLAAAAHRLHPGLVTAYHILVVAGAVAVAATAAAAVVFAVAIARNTPAERRSPTYALMAVPALIAVAWMGGVWWLAHAHLAKSTGFPIFVTWLLLGVAGIAVATVVVTRLVKGAELPARTWQVGVSAAVTVTGAMVVATGAFLAWGVLMRDSQAVTGSAADIGGWLLVSAIMAVTAGRAVIALLSLGRPGAPQPG